MIEFLLIITVLVLISILVQLKTLNRKVRRIMNAEEKLVEYVAEINAETTRIAGLIEDLVSQSKAGDLDVDELTAWLDPVVTALKAVGVVPPEVGS